MNHPSTGPSHAYAVLPRLLRGRLRMVRTDRAREFLVRPIPTAVDLMKRLATRFALCRTGLPTCCPDVLLELVLPVPEFLVVLVARLATGVRLRAAVRFVRRLRAERAPPARRPAIWRRRLRLRDLRDPPPPPMRTARLVRSGAGACCGDV